MAPHNAAEPDVPGFLFATCQVGAERDLEARAHAAVVVVPVKPPPDVALADRAPPG